MLNLLCLVWLATVAVAAGGVNDGVGHGHLPLWPLKFNAPIHQARPIVCFPCRRHRFGVITTPWAYGPTKYYPPDAGRRSISRYLEKF